MFSNQKPNLVEGWICVYSTNTEVDAALISNYLSSCEIENQILSKRDSAYNLNVGDMSNVYVYVPQELEDATMNALKEWEAGETELPEEEME